MFLHINNVKIKRRDNVKAVDNMLLFLGYQPQSIGKLNWLNKSNQTTYNKFVRENHPEKLNIEHKDTFYDLLEARRITRNEVLDNERNSVQDHSGDEKISIEELFRLFFKYIHIEYTDTLKLLEQNEFDMTPFINDFELLKFIKEYGIVTLDNEIHLTGYKEQVKKIKLILKKYAKLQKYY